MRPSLAVIGLGAAIVIAFFALGQYAPEANWNVFEPYSVMPARYSGAAPATPGDLVTPLFAHVFFHYGVFHLLMNGLAYLQAAPFVALRLGDVRFLALFFISAIGGALTYIFINPDSTTGAVGASGAICGVFGAYFLAARPTPRAAFADPAVRNAMFGFLTINVVLMAVLPLPIAWEAHLGGFIAGAFAYALLAPRRRATGPWG